MADRYSVLIVALTITGCLAVDRITGFYCQDPDTKNLYPVNATWRSESFCGNYTCKLRKLNATETQYKPLVINITNPNLIPDNKKQEHNPNENSIIDDMSIAASNIVAEEKKAPPEVIPILKHFVHKYNVSTHTNEDRYLSNVEIESLAKMLHSVKKSDLDALIEIYNLAQDIFKEIDQKTNDDLVDDTMNIIDHNVKESNLQQKTANSMVSYFYTPLHKTPDMDNAASNNYGTVEIKQTQPFYKPSGYSEVHSVPYYYPLSNFQRQSSYVHLQPTPNPTPYPTIIQQTAPSCSRNNPNNLCPWYYKQIPKTRPEVPATYYPPGPILLPYPYTMISKSENKFPSFYQLGGPWLETRQQPLPTSDNNSEVTKKKTSDKEPKDSENADNVLNNENKESKLISKLPDWKTDPLSDSVLDEIRAKVLDKTFLQPIPLRKKIKIERVGKIFKIGEEKRPKREAKEEFEAVIVKTTCESTQEMEPGYFKMGNPGQPYPECCPKRIPVEPSQIIQNTSPQDQETTTT